MAFKIWQIGLHLQQQEAVAVAIVRGAKECFCNAGGGCRWRTTLSKMGGLLMRSSWLKRCYRGVANCRSVITLCWRFPPVAHYSGHFRARRCPLVSGSKRPGCQGRWPAGWIWIRTPALRLQRRLTSPAYNVTAAQSKELATLLTLAERLRVHVSAITPDASALQRFLPFYLLISNVWPGVITNSGCGRRAIAGGANWRWG